MCEYKIGSISMSDTLGSSGGYLGSDTYSECGNGNSTTVCTTDCSTAVGEFVTASPNGGIKDNVTNCERKVASAHVDYVVVEVVV